LLYFDGHARTQDTVPFRFAVHAPVGRRPAARLYLTGDAAALGAWRPDGLALARGKDGVFRATVALPRGATVQYKVTRGTWQTVERDVHGTDIANRTVVVEGADSVEINVERWAEPRSTRGGRIREHRVAGRAVYVYVPPDYGKNARQRYPVLYMHDGQNLFDAATAAFGIEWRVDDTANRLIRAGRIEPLIVVGIQNASDRGKEYAAPFGARAGHADAYAHFLLNAVKPLIDRRYRTRPDRENTAVGGASLGGNVSLYIAASHPDRFAMCAALSPSVWYQGDRFVRHVAKALRPAKQRVHVLVGTAEGKSVKACEDYVRGARKLVAALQKRGFGAARMRYREVEGGRHNEADWSEQMEEVLLFLFGTPRAE